MRRRRRSEIGVFQIRPESGHFLGYTIKNNGLS